MSDQRFHVESQIRIFGFLRIYEHKNVSCLSYVNHCDDYWNYLNRLFVSESANVEDLLHFNAVYDASRKMKNKKTHQSF